MFNHNIDKWKHLRTNLFNNTEVSVQLLGSDFLFESEEDYFKALGGVGGLHLNHNRIPGFIARESYDSEPNEESDIRLTKQLITSKPKPHTVPFEFTHWTFKVRGISKGSLTQLDRHRSPFIQQSGRFMDRGNTMFVYDAYEDMLDEDEEIVKQWYAEDEAEVKRCLGLYADLKTRQRRVSKNSRQSARRKLTLDFATGTYFTIHSLAFRNMTELRLDFRAEWEIMRVVKLCYDRVMLVAPAQMHNMILPEGL